jgi:hypothetical protein
LRGNLILTFHSQHCVVLPRRGADYCWDYKLDLPTSGRKHIVAQQSVFSILTLAQNVVLNVWCLFCALIGTQLIARWGRKPSALLCQALLTGLLFAIGGISKKYADNPDGASSAVVYGDVAAMFLFQGAYSLCWTPILNLWV